MRKSASALVFGLSMMAAVPSVAIAADIPVKAPRPAVPVYAPPPFTWTGFYIGGNVGYGWADVSSNGFSSNLNGVIGGGQIGYNWQTGPLVIGIEGDIQGSGQDTSDGVTLSGTPYTVNQKIPWFATLRGRIGYANGPLMVYFTGGGAWANYKLDVSTAAGTASDDTTKTAWTIGGGLEWMFAPKWSAKLEYLYLDTGDRSATLSGNTFTGRAKDNIVRVGLNYHF